MTFTPTFRTIDERQPWKNEYYNSLVQDFLNAYLAIGGDSMTAPLVLSKTGQHLDGVAHYIYSFKRWFGNGNNTSVRDVCGFGATGLGSADDSGAIMSAIDDLPVTGGCVIVPPGTYLVDANTVKLTGSSSSSSAKKSNVTLLGFGRHSIIKLATGANKDLLSLGGGTGMKVANIQLDGNSGGQTTTTLSSLDASDSVDCRISRCFFNTASGYGVKVGNATRASISNSDFLTAFVYHGNSNPATDLTILNSYFQGAGDGISLGPINGAIIEACDFSSNTNGIYITTSAAGNSRGIIVAGGTFASQTNDAIQIKSLIQGTRVSEVTLSGFSVYGAARHGVYVSGQSQTAMRAIVINCINVDKCGGSGVKMENNVRFSAVHGSTISNNLSGIDILGADNMETTHVSVTGNACFDDQGSPTQTYGIQLNAKTNNCAVVGNVVNGNTVAQISDLGVNNDIGHNPGYPS